jgi:hypothetical protein
MSQYDFPSQADTLAYTLAAVRAEIFNPRALFVFGTYTIGKERLFLEVREIGIAPPMLVQNDLYPLALAFLLHHQWPGLK